MKKSLIAIAVIGLSAISGLAIGQAGGLDQLLEQVRRAAQTEGQVNQQREQEFRNQRDRQRQLLAQARAQLAAEERRSDELKNEFDNNERALADLETVLQERMGNLGEMFGVVRQVAGDARGQFENSIISAQIPGRSPFLRELQERKALPNISELRRLWFEIQREITEQGKVVEFTADILDSNGELQRGRTIQRIGVFNAVSGGKFLQWQEPEGTQTDGRLYEQKRQPAARFLSQVENFENASAGSVVPMAVDFSRGAILRLVVETKTWGERVEEDGGPVGFVIVGLGIVGLLLAFFRAIVLAIKGMKMKSQLKSDTPDPGNPLGRVMQVYTDNPDADVETLELKLDEAILRETGPMEAGLSLLKVMYVVAPLLGLLGTVVGMIGTFQAITLFGTGDPKMMAGGISQALVTTVLGLVVAIPLTLIHSILAARARRMIHILEEQAAGIVAMMAER